MKAILYIVMIVFLFGARGDLVSYELLDEIDQLTAQAVVDSFIPTGPDIAQVEISFLAFFIL